MTLSVSTKNPRYVTDATGKEILLAGFEFWDSWLWADPTTERDLTFSQFLTLIAPCGVNLIRLWRNCELTRFYEGGELSNLTSRIPWQRTGPGNAYDGLPKFDLTLFNQTYFDELRAKVVAAQNAGYYVAVMLFEGYPDPFEYHPYYSINNINSISGTTSTFHTLSDSDITDINDAYIEKVINTLNDLDNIFYEVSNEEQSDALNGAWQEHVISKIKTYEAGKSKQHLVLRSPSYGYGADHNDWITGSSVDIVGVDAITWPQLDYYPSVPGNKPYLIDTDHWGGIFSPSDYTWKIFTRGYGGLINFLGYDQLQSSDPDYVASKNAVGQILSYSQKMGLADMTPQTGLSSTGFCLANTGKEYLFYQPGTGSFTIAVPINSYRYEWFNPATGVIAESGLAFFNSGTVTPPFSGSAVLYLKDPPMAASTPYKGAPFAVPGRIEAEDFDNGGEGVGYHKHPKAPTKNEGGAYRNEGVGIEPCSEGGYNVGWVWGTEWLIYSIKVIEPGKYDFIPRVASAVSGTKKMHIEIDGVDVTGPMIFTDSSGWQSWKDILASGINLTAGNHLMKVVFDTGNHNLNYIDVKKSEGILPSAEYLINKDANGNYFFTINLNLIKYRVEIKKVI